MLTMDSIGIAGMLKDEKRLLELYKESRACTKKLHQVVRSLNIILQPKRDHLQFPSC